MLALAEPHRRALWHVVRHTNLLVGFGASARLEPALIRGSAGAADGCSESVKLMSAFFFVSPHVFQIFALALVLQMSA